METAICPIVVGNWKMNPHTAHMAERLALDIKEGLPRTTAVEVVVAPPTLYLGVVEKARNGSKRFKLGAQDAFYEKLGAYTGNVSALMLESAGVSHVIIGHSERRALGEDDVMVNKKVHAVTKAGMTAVVCIGEQRRDTHGQYLEFVETQIRAACAGITRSRLVQLIIAYEPIWAISTSGGAAAGKGATSEDIHEMKLFIQKVLSDLYGRSSANNVKILYGGSVNPKNAQEILKGGMVNGFLVGGASLRPADFIGIVRACA